MPTCDISTLFGEVSFDEYVAVEGFTAIFIRHFCVASKVSINVCDLGLKSTTYVRKVPRLYVLQTIKGIFGFL